MGTPLGPKYIPYTYMDPLGVSTPSLGFRVWARAWDSQVPKPKGPDIFV